MKKIKCTTLCPFRMDNGYCLLYSRKIDIYCFQAEEKRFRDHWAECYTEAEWEKWKREKPFWVKLETELREE